MHYPTLPHFLHILFPFSRHFARQTKTVKSLILPLPGGQSRCKVVTSDQDGQAFWELRYLLHNLGQRMDCWRWTRPDHSTPAHRTASTLRRPGLDPHAYMRWLHQKQQRGGIASLALSCQLDPSGLRRSRRHEAQKLLTGAGGSLAEVERAPKAGLCRLSTVAYLLDSRIADSRTLGSGQGLGLSVAEGGRPLD